MTTTTFNTNNTWIKTVDFTNCIGSAIKTDKKLQLWSCTFIYCSTDENGGGVRSTGTFLRSNSCLYQSCTAQYMGGAIYLIGGQLDTFRTDYIECTANVGPAIYHSDLGENGQKNLEPNYFVSSLFYKCTGIDDYVFYSRIYSTLVREGLMKINVEFCRFEAGNETDAFTVDSIDTGEKVNVSLIGLYRNIFYIKGGTAWRPATATFTPTASRSLFPTLSPTISATFHPTVTATFAATLSLTPGVTPQYTVSPTASKPPTISATFWPTRTATFWPTITATFWPTVTATFAPTPEITPTFPATPAYTPERTAPSPSFTPYPSRTPCITWPKLGLGLLILFLIIAIIGIIANIFLCRISARSGKKMAKQIIDGRQGDEEDDGCCAKYCGLYCCC
ncbi:hypothetical protein TVAG_487590 [Trichomonas vaginalis G3]|uniref:Uncharacterized protein n=1 Tax=Trichomonas vaginalis (strain ATCC PRA-98 / G3) TaxID=412133 RepID=A2EFN7_TRIV3|nr:hypothetical protein TVAGG3_0062170 [Trichomonas vaginalis G3]EAY08532.1 hypothetical protein TVAG_487590 [Trichomonas vaginalis G3]KAI5542093.1 hypothetical protein TVAGG3_0062170 [Trichomonas vaginalis G3]|eukprot:XP_001320755.1 hypothetical protein [Trichomonas vaginalis G3]